MEELDLKELSSILWRKKFIILIIVLIFAILGIIYSYKIITPDYKASTTLILGRINASSSDVLSQGRGQDTNQITQSEITINSNLVSTYSELIKSKSLTQKVKDNLKIHIDDKEFRKNINVSRIAETELIEITVTNRDGKLAADIANEIAKVFSEKIEEIYNISNVYIIDSAVETDIPYNINHFKDILIFIVLGIIISLGYIIIYSMLDTTIKSSEDIEKDIGIKTLISIPVRKENKKENYLNELITYSDARSINSEVFKTLRTNVQFSNINNKENKVMLITSCFSSEGKSYISANLATAFAQAGKKVVLIDADMRRGRQSRIFKLPNELGLSNYLSNLDNNGMEINERINKYINETEIKNLNIITSGNIPPNPSELLTSNKLPELIKELSIFYDLIIFDGAPVLPIADSLILTRMANSTILVSLYNKTKKDELLKAKKDIQNVGGRIIGAVLNKVPNSNYEYENKYYYGKDEEEKVKKIVKINKKANKSKESIKSKIEKVTKKIKNKIDEKLKNRIKNKIKLLAPGIENTNVLDDDKTIKEYEEELKRLENEKKEKIKREQLKKRKEQEKIEEEKQKIREELVKNKEAEIINKNNEKIKEEQKIKEDLELEKKKIEEAKKKNQEEIEKRKQEEQKQKEYLEEERIKQELEEKEKQEEAKRKKIEEEKARREKRKEELKENFKQNTDKIKQNLEEIKIRFKEKKDEFIKKVEDIREENKIKYKKNKKIREEEKLKKKELKEEKEKSEKEKRAREAEENELRRQREFEEREKLRIIKEEERKEKDRELENERQIKLEKKLEEKVKRNQAKEEKRKFREQEKQRQKEEERIKEQILEDNLYPKTKYNKDL